MTEIGFAGELMSHTFTQPFPQVYTLLLTLLNATAQTTPPCCRYARNLEFFGTPALEEGTAIGAVDVLSDAA